MKNKILIIIFFTFLINTLTLAQTYTLYGDKVFGTGNYDIATSIINIGNGHLLISGTSAGDINGDKTETKCNFPIGTYDPYDVWILKIDTAFNIIWDKSIGGGRDEHVTQLLYLKNQSKIIITTESASDSSCEKSSYPKGYLLPYPNDYWILNMDTNGNPINDFTWGGNKQEFAPQTIQLNSGNFIIGGISNSTISGDVTVANYDSTNGLNTNDKFDYWVVKTDSIGNKIWDNHYGGTGEEGGQDQYCLLPDDHDNFILAGNTASPISGDISQSSKGLTDVWIIKIDSVGNKVWDKRYGGTGENECMHIIKSNDDGYILCGNTNSPLGGDVSEASKGKKDCWIIKLDPQGNKQWDKRYGGNEDDIATWIEKAPGGGYWVSGRTRSDSSGDVSEPNYGVYSDYWIFKINESGKLLWEKRFGGPGNDGNTSFVIMPDSSIYLAGGAEKGFSAVKTDSGHWNYDYWIVHFKYTDTLSSVGIYTINNFSTNLSIFPNPTKDIVTITSATENIKSIALVNLLGETLLEQKVNNARTTQLNLQPYPSGFYFVKITGADYSVVKKVLRQ